MSGAEADSGLHVPWGAAREVGEGAKKDEDCLCERNSNGCG